MADKIIDKPSLHHPKFNFFKKYISSSSKEGLMSIQEWVDSFKIEQDSEIFLQMDI